MTHHPAAWAQGGLHHREAGAGPVALFVHGFPLDSRLWLDQIDALADIRRCVAVDLRGFGSSPPTRSSRMTMDDHAADLAAFLDTLGVDTVDLVGLSMGGYVALALAGRQPGRLRSLALVDTRSGPDGDDARRGRDEGIRRVLAEGRDAFVRGMVSGLLAPEAAPVAAARFLTMAEDTPYETLVASLAGMRDRPDRTPVLETITCPVAVVVGEHDAVTPPAAAHAMAAAAGGAEVHVILKPNG
jgi:pimeloyl-ACP methyl ester carboxylesterase